MPSLWLLLLAPMMLQYLSIVLLGPLKFVCVAVLIKAAHALCEPKARYRFAIWDGLWMLRGVEVGPRGILAVGVVALGLLFAAFRVDSVIKTASSEMSPDDSNVALLREPLEAALPSPAPEEPTLVEARRGFSTKLLQKFSIREAPPKPPPNIFQLVKYPSPVGDLAAYVTPRPKDGTRRPAVIWITGGFDNDIGATAWEPAPRENDQSARAFREANLVLMLPSLRGGNANPGYIENFYGEVDDVIAAADYLVKLDYVDPDRIYLGGHSTGGMLVLLVAEATNRFRAVFSLGPASSAYNYEEDNYFFDTSDERELKLRSPILFLHSIQTPTFIIEGAEEPTRRLECIELAEAAGDAPVTTLIVPDADHYDIVAPLTKRLAGKIMADVGPTSNISFSEAELATAMTAPATARK
jgi:dienelactone hydrolase